MHWKPGYYRLEWDKETRRHIERYINKPCRCWTKEELQEKRNKDKGREAV